MKLFGNYNSTKTTLLDCDQLDSRFNPVTFSSSNRARHIRIAIDSNLKIKVTYPNKIKIQKAEDFFKSQLVWTTNNLIKLTKRLEIKSNNIKASQKKLTRQEFLAKNQYLIQRCSSLAKEHNFQVKNISLRRQKTIWGSCSGSNSISLNSNLAFLNDDLIDYVILHELAHTKVKNHSQHFWDELKKVLPKAKLLDKELRNYSPDFFNKTT
jgi:predicted metal-dependent hydrolase